MFDVKTVKITLYSALPFLLFKTTCYEIRLEKLKGY